MKIEFELVEKSFKREDGQDIKYYVIRKLLADKTYLEVSIKSDKAKVLMMNQLVENRKQM